MATDWPQNPFEGVDFTVDEEGDEVPEEDWPLGGLEERPAPDGDFCDICWQGWVCTRPAGHSGAHVAHHDEEGPKVCAKWWEKNPYEGLDTGVHDDDC